MMAKKYINYVTAKNKWQSIWDKQKINLNEIKGDTSRWLNPYFNRKEDIVLNRILVITYIYSRFPDG